MFANRFTALIDACVLASALKRNLVLTLAEAEFFRLRWSERILDETEAAIIKIFRDKGAEDASERGARARAAMVQAFEEACVGDFAEMMGAVVGLPDENDRHVVAAALKTSASVIVTDNLKDFPEAVLAPLNLEARNADAFIADTITLDLGRAIAAIQKMRLRLKKPEKTADVLLLDMEAAGLTETVDVLKLHVQSL